MRLLFALLAVVARPARRRCSTSKDAVQTGQEFTFVAPGGQTTILYDPPESRGALRLAVGREPADPGHHRRARRTTPGRVVVLNIWGSWCGPCRDRGPDLEFVAAADRRRTGCRCWVWTSATTAAAAADFIRDRGITYDSVFDPPGRTLPVLRGYPRNTVPSTIVLDRQHRVAAVYLTTIRVPELIPLVQRLAAEPAPCLSASDDDSDVRRDRARCLRVAAARCHARTVSRRARRDVPRQSPTRLTLDGARRVTAAQIAGAAIRSPATDGRRPTTTLRIIDLDRRWLRARFVSRRRLRYPTTRRIYAP